MSSEQRRAAAESGLALGVENQIGLRFVLIPPGTDALGSSEAESGHERYERIHDVQISRPFYMQITEVTNAQYRMYRPGHSSGAYGESSLDDPNQPVCAVSWTDAAEFAAWLTDAESDYVYRLPTEAEWEYACRAGGGGAYGCEVDGEQLYQYGNTMEVADLRGATPTDTMDGFVCSAPVASYRPNRWGLFDMHGNVSEWCLDWFSAYPDRDLLQDPTGPRKGRVKVVRGGWWHSGRSQVRCAARRSAPPDDLRMGRGFRLVCRQRSSTE